MNMNMYKLELIRADDAQQITYAVTTKFQACEAQQLVDGFIDFASGCGFHKNSLMDAMQLRIDEEVST